MAKPRVLVVRDAAIGDLIQMTPIIRHLNKEGYRVNVATKKAAGNAVLPNNPYVEEAILLDQNEVLQERQKRIEDILSRKPYEHCFDFVHSVEARYLFHSTRPEYYYPVEHRRVISDSVNYVEDMCEMVGATDRKMELFETVFERKDFEKMRAGLLGGPIVQIQLTGSSKNKCLPWWPLVIKDLISLYPNITIITTGEERAQILERGIIASVGRRNILPMSGTASIRRALLLTKHVDLVIGPETGVLNAAACFDTPKIVLLTHSNHTNLSRDWSNVYPLQSPSECSPCYRIVGDGDPCWRITDKESPIRGAMKCMAQFQYKTIVETARKALSDAQNRKES